MHQGDRYHDRKRIDRIPQVLELAAILKVVSRFQLDMLVKGFLDSTHDFLDISVTDIHPDHDTAFRGIPVNL